MVGMASKRLMSAIAALLAVGAVASGAWWLMHGSRVENSQRNQCHSNMIHLSMALRRIMMEEATRESFLKSIADGKAPMRLIAERASSLKLLICPSNPRAETLAGLSEEELARVLRDEDIAYETWTWRERRLEMATGPKPERTMPTTIWEKVPAHAGRRMVCLTPPSIRQYTEKGFQSRMALSRGLLDVGELEEREDGPP